MSVEKYKQMRNEMTQKDLDYSDPETIDDEKDSEENIEEDDESEESIY